MRITTLLVTVAALFASPVLVGCSSPAGEETATSDIVTANGDELVSSGPTYAAGTSLRTTSAVNFRSGPGTTYAIQRVLPNGTKVTVRQASGANAWVAVSYSGYSGWVHTSYLTTNTANTATATGAPSTYSSTRASKLASTADRVDGQRAGGNCAREVSDSVIASGTTSGWARGNAIDITYHLRDSSSYRNQVRFQTLGVSAYDIPKGSIIGWRRGQCGYSSTYGHIEIAIDGSSSRACSDFCGSIKKTCGAPYVFIPTN